MWYNELNYNKNLLVAIQQNLRQEVTYNMKKIGKIFETILSIFFGILFIIPATIIVLIDYICNKTSLAKQFKKIKNAGYKISKVKETGKDLKSHYRETSEGGLAKKYCRNKYIVSEKDMD